MRHVRMLGLCLVAVFAVFAVAAVAATSAMALPEWGKCEAKAGGKYSDANCTVKAKKGAGAFEWIKGKNLKPVKFTGKNVGSGGVLSTKLWECHEEHEVGGHGIRVPRSACGGYFPLLGPITVECTSESSSGEAVGTNSIANVSVVFKGCLAFGSAPCTSEGAEEGEIRVNPLKGTLGYINKAEKTVGVLLEPVKKHGPFAEFVCAGALFTGVGAGNTKEGAFYTPESKGGYDGVISPITPVNTMTSTYEQVYTSNGSEVEPANVPSKFEGKHIELLEDYVENSEAGLGNGNSTQWSPASEEITNLNTTAEPGEIKG